MDKKVVLITGSSIGLGASIAEKFASNNYNVVINYLTHEKEALKLKNNLEEKYNIECLCIEADISKDEDIKYMHKMVMNTFHKVDVLINNASVSYDSEFDSKIKDIFMKILEINVYGTFNVTKIFGTDMLKRKSGKIINIASTNGIDTYYEYGLDYDASKAAVINLTHNLANHYAPYINVNCVCPGWIDTPMNKNMDEEFKKQEEAKILIGRFAKSEEIASLVYFLSTDEASYINDSIIRIDGGRKC